MIFFLWVDARTLGFLVFPATSASYAYHEALGSVWVHYVISGLTIFLAAAATSFLWYPRAGWPQVTLFTLAFLAATTAGGVWHTLRHLDIARETYATSRAARGLPVSAERLDTMFKPESLLWTLLGGLLLYTILGIAAWRRRWYTDEDTD